MQLNVKEVSGERIIRVSHQCQNVLCQCPLKHQILSL